MFPHTHACARDMFYMYNILFTKNILSVLPGL